MKNQIKTKKETRSKGRPRHNKERKAPYTVCLTPTMRDLIYSKYDGLVNFIETCFYEKFNKIQ